MTKVTLLYPPQQAQKGHAYKPEASLAYPYLAGALLSAGHDVSVYDACVGNEKDSLAVFHRGTELSSGLLRYGVSDARILEEVAGSDIVGITSIFTAQETMALHVGRLIKRQFPNKLVVAGGTNARSRYRRFLTAGFDAVCSSEAERTIVELANRPDRCRGGLLTPQDLIVDLDALPIPVWELHPNERYWRIGRPHGAAQETNGLFRYASVMTSRGCVFSCNYCHISGEHDEPSISQFRVKSVTRVRQELTKLKSLGVEHLFIEDDTLFGHKQRGIGLLKQIKDFGFHLWGINGINITHLFRYNQALKKYSPDYELLDVLQECGFKAISLPVESGSQRIIDKYASGKWHIDRFDIARLIQDLNHHGISTGVNYMIGYPDETIEEIEATCNMARRHMDAGAQSANIMLVIPLPGTRLHDEAIQKGYLDKDFNPDTFNWRRASMKNTVVPPARLEEIQRSVYQELNVPGIGAKL